MWTIWLSTDANKKTFELQTILVMLPPLAKLLQLYCVAELVDAVRPKPVLVDGLKNWTLGLAGNPWVTICWEITFDCFCFLQNNQRTQYFNKYIDNINDN
jgi:hypothetical protein